MADEQPDIAPILIGKTTYRLRLSVRHRSGQHMGTVTLESEKPFGSIHEGERMTIGDLEGYHESRLTIGRIRDVSHTFTGGSRGFTHAVTVHVDQDDPE
jgi:hypothetical protein